MVFKRLFLKGHACKDNWWFWLSLKAFLGVHIILEKAFVKESYRTICGFGGLESRAVFKVVLKAILGVPILLVRLF